MISAETVSVRANNQIRQSGKLERPEGGACEVEGCSQEQLSTTENERVITGS